MLVLLTPEKPNLGKVEDVFIWWQTAKEQPAPLTLTDSWYFVDDHDDLMIFVYLTLNGGTNALLRTPAQLIDMIVHVL